VRFPDGHSFKKDRATRPSFGGFVGYNGPMGRRRHRACEANYNHTVAGGGSSASPLLPGGQYQYRKKSCRVGNDFGATGASCYYSMTTIQRPLLRGDQVCHMISHPRPAHLLRGFTAQVQLATGGEMSRLTAARNLR